MGFLFVLFVSLAACAAPAPKSGPTIVVRNTQPDAPDGSDADIHAAAIAGANDWAALGVDGRAYDGAGTECALQWFDAASTQLPCTVTISVTYIAASSFPSLPDGTRPLGVATIDERNVFLDVELSPAHLESIAAHEFGHCLWYSDAHLPVGDWGIMMANTEWLTEVSAADADYAATSSDGWAVP